MQRFNSSSYINRITQSQSLILWLRHWLYPIIALGIAWVIGIAYLQADYDQKIAIARAQYINDTLDEKVKPKAEEIERKIIAIYQDIRTISLLPGVRKIHGRNRTNANIDPVKIGALSEDADATIQQVYNNLASGVAVSEVYAVLKGFAPEKGEVPFFMYDHLIVQASKEAEAESSNKDSSDVPKQLEDYEYLYFPKQLDWFATHYPTFNFTKLGQIPALASPLMRTCDNSQYTSIRSGDVRNTFGMLFSVPFYDLKTNQFKGLVSAIVRKNVFEAALLGIPFIPITQKDQEQAKALHLEIPNQSNFLLENKFYKIRIADRRRMDIINNVIPKDWIPLSVELAVPGQEGHWRLHYFITPSEISDVVGPIERGKWRDIGIFSLAMLMIHAMLIRMVRVRSRAAELLKQQASYDALTNLPNRSHFLEILDKAIARAKKDTKKVALIFIDINNFKPINDNLGHEAGDEILRQFSHRGQQVLKGFHENKAQHSIANITLARLAGDEFTAIIEDYSDTKSLIGFINELFAAIDKPFMINGHPLSVSISLGIALYPNDALDASTLIRHADQAMYQVKGKKANSFAIFDENLRLQSERTLQLERDLLLAFDKQEFFLMFQPLINARTKVLEGFETLLRWRNTELGVVSPDEFVPLLERSGGICQVGEWIIRQSLYHLKHWRSLGMSNLSIHVNLSSRQLRDVNLPDHVQRCLDETGINSNGMVLELTESLMMENFTDSLQVLNAFKKFGIRLALDDFGTGYCSLTYLRHLPVELIKLDRGFIGGLESEEGQHITEAIIKLCHSLNFSVVAEGIETAQQLDWLTESGCDYLQGMYLHPPLLDTEATELIEKLVTSSNKTLATH